MRSCPEGLLGCKFNCTTLASPQEWCHLLQFILQSIECRSSPSQEVRFGGCEPGALQISHPEPQFLLLRSRILWDPMRPRGRVRGGSRPSETIESDHLNTLFLRRSVYFFILGNFWERYRGRKWPRRSKPCSTMRF